MRPIDLVKERPRELALSGGEALLFAELYQLGIVADVDHAEGIVVGPEAQGDLAGRTLQILDIELAAARRIEQVLQSLVKHLRRAEAAYVEIGETSSKEVLAHRSDEPMVEH